MVMNLKHFSIQLFITCWLMTRLMQLHTAVCQDKNGFYWTYVYLGCCTVYIGG